MRRWVVLAIGVVVLGTAVPAFAGLTEWPSTNSNIGYTDDWDFNYTSTESNLMDYEDFVGYMDYAMFTIWGGKTDLVARSKGRTFYDWIDIGGFMTVFDEPDVAGDCICRKWSNQYWRICDRNRVRFTEDLLTRTPKTPSVLSRRNTACHEVGHAVGFGHGTTSDSCMTNGNNADISSYEIGLVNARR